MTHTLHRMGDINSLSEDYIILIMPSKNVNLKGAPEKIKQIFELLSNYDSQLVNFGNAKGGNNNLSSLSQFDEKETRLIHAVFKDKKSLASCLKELKTRDIGLSVVVSGIYKDVENICEEIGLTPHTVEYSLGIHGNTSRLPDDNILEITTMCGHALVSPNLVIHMINQLNDGKLTYEEAAQELSKGCVCGIFNPHRAKKVLEMIVSNPKQIVNRVV